MASKNIYIKDSDEALIARAEENLPGGKSLSSLFSEFLNERYTRMNKKPTSVEKIKLRVGDPPITKVFEGRWLFGDEERDGIRAEPDQSGVSWNFKRLYSAAQTKAGRLVVYERDPDDAGGDMEVYEDFEEFRDDLIDNRYSKYPENVIAAVSEALGVPFEVELDI